MELLEKLADKLVAAGPWGILAAVLIGVIVAMTFALKKIYDDNQRHHQVLIDHQRDCTEDAKEYARGLAAGIATLDAIKELSKDMFAIMAATRNKGR